MYTLAPTVSIHEFNVISYASSEEYLRAWALRNILETKQISYATNLPSCPLPPWVSLKIWVRSHIGPVVSHRSNVRPSQKLGGTWLTTQISNVICGMWNNDQWLLISATSFHPGNTVLFMATNVDAGLGWFALISYVATLMKAFLYWLQSVALYSGSCGLHRFPLK